MRKLKIITVVMLLVVMGISGFSIKTTDAFGGIRNLYVIREMGIYLTSYGNIETLAYADIDWMSAIKYDTSGGVRWLQPFMMHPYWYSNSNFEIVSVISGSTSYLQSTIKNPHIEVKIESSKVDDITMKQVYTIKNITSNYLDNLYFYQFLHGHPSGQAIGIDNVAEYKDNSITIRGTWAHDPNLYGYLKMWSPTAAPVNWDVGWYKGHWGEKPNQLELRVEKDDLWGTKSISDSELAGVLKWKLRERLNPHNSVSHIVHLEAAVVPEPCTMLLLGTGLVGLAGRRIMMRRKRG